MGGIDYINNKSINESQLRQSESKLDALKSWLHKLGTSDFESAAAVVMRLRLIAYSLCLKAQGHSLCREIVYLLIYVE